MKITMKHVENLLKLFDIGLIHGPGSQIDSFCVQQAVNRVIHEDLGNPNYNDHPLGCIKQELISMGINLNDCAQGISKKERANALKRFAVAQMGSTKINMAQFRKKVQERIRYIGPDDLEGNQFIHTWMANRNKGESKYAKLKALADTLADVLKEMGTEGSQFLYLVDEPDKEKQAQEARRLGHKIYGSQLAEMDSFGTGRCGIGGCSPMK